MELSRYRKLVVALVTAGSLKLLDLFGIGPTNLSAIGIGIGDFAGDVADFILTVGIPGFFLWLFPQEPENGNETGHARHINNKRLLIFIGGVMAATAAGIGLSLVL